MVAAAITTSFSRCSTRLRRRFYRQRRSPRAFSPAPSLRRGTLRPVPFSPGQGQFRIQDERQAFVPTPKQPSTDDFSRNCLRRTRLLGSCYVRLRRDRSTSKLANAIQETVGEAADLDVLQRRDPHALINADRASDGGQRKDSVANVVRRAHDAMPRPGRLKLNDPNTLRR